MRKLIDWYRSLETVEQKSFWAIAPIASVVGILSIFLSATSFSTEFYLIMGLICAAFPIIMMVWCWQSRNYHTCYTILVIGIGGILIPVAFLTNGGFNSGMPIFCMAGTILGAFCYEKRNRFIAFTVSLFLTFAAFYICDRIGTLNAVNPEWVQKDIVLSYLMVSVGLFLIINMLLTETKNYATDATVLSDYVDSNVKAQLVKRAKKGDAGAGEKGMVTVLFADVSRFTTTTERMEPEDAASYLNTFLTIADESIHANGGILDKYIGDCAMAYWVDPGGTGEGILDAIKAVMDMRDRLYDASEDIFAKYKTEMNFSAGIEYGEVVLGNIGSGNRKDYTIIGDAVNTASRLEGKASPGELIISDNIVRKVGDHLKLADEVYECSLKGKNRNVKLYSVLGFRDPEPDITGLILEQVKKNPFRKMEKGEPDDSRERYKFYVCGCRGSLPVSGLRFSEFGGETSCYVLRKGDYALVMDTGTGLLNAEPILRGCKNIDLLFTHVHYDHILGLLNLAVFPKDVKMRLFGHFGSWAGEGTIRNFLDSPYWPVPFPDVPVTDVILAREYRLTEEIGATFYRTFHPDNGCVIKLMIGKDKICLYSDLEDPSYMDPDIARCSDLLLYDGMFDRRDPVQHKGWGHSTWQDGVEYAKAENVKKLLITHHDPKAGDHELRERERQAKELFERSAFARSGDIFVL